MKKTILTLLAAAMLLPVSAQQKMVTGNKFFDNWYSGVMVGTVHSPYFDKMRPALGIELGKQITPVLGVSFEGITGINTTASSTAFDDLNLTLNGKINFMNLFGGYPGQPRLFEIEGIVGAGLFNEFQKNHIDNAFSMRAGGSFNFNLGKGKQWTIKVRPAYVAVIDGTGTRDLYNASRFELMGGVTYHFKCSNGKHHMSTTTGYSQDEVDRLNEQINEMRSKVNDLENNVTAAQQTNEALQSELNNCRKNAEMNKGNQLDYTMEPVVSFRQNYALLEKSQLSNLENIANFMKNNPDVKVKVQGYASPEGREEFNQKLSEERAYTVKEILVNKYGIEADRIDAKGMGVGSHFSEPEMNRAAVINFYK